MANEKPIDVSIWEKIGDGLSAFSEGFAGLLTRLLGSSNERVIRKLGYIRPRRPTDAARIIPGSIVARVNDLEEKTRALSDTQLRDLTTEFRQRLKDGESLEGS